MLVVDNSLTTYGVSAEIMSIVTESIFKKLKKSPQRIGIKNLLIPSTRELAKHCYLDSKNILEKIVSITGKKINKKKKNLFLKEMTTHDSDIPYKDFKGPF